MRKHNFIFLQKYLKGKVVAKEKIQEVKEVHKEHDHMMSLMRRNEILLMRTRL